MPLPVELPSHNFLCCLSLQNTVRNWRCWKCSQISGFGEIWREIALEPPWKFSGQICSGRFLVPVSVPGFWGVCLKIYRWDSKQFKISERLFWRDLERIGEIRAYITHRKYRVIIIFLAGTPRVISYFHFKKIIKEKAFRTRKWRQF